MNDDGTDNGAPAPTTRKPGTFQAGNQAAKGGGKGKAKQPRGLASEVRRHKRIIVKGWLDLAKNGTATAKARALTELSRIGWGSPASAAEMGVLDPVERDPMRHGGANPNSGQPDGLRGFLDALDDAPALDLSRLSIEQLEQLKNLASISRGVAPASVDLERERHELAAAFERALVGAAIAPRPPSGGIPSDLGVRPTAGRLSAPSTVQEPRTQPSMPSSSPSTSAPPAASAEPTATSPAVEEARRPTPATPISELEWSPAQNLIPFPPGGRR